MRRITRRRRHEQNRKIRLFIFLSGGLLTAVLLVFALVWLEDLSQGNKPSMLKNQDEPQDVLDERPGKFIFYKALKEPNPDGAELMPLVPKSEEPKPLLEALAPKSTTPKPSSRSPSSLGSSTYTVQVAAFRDKTDAQALIDRLIQKGYPAHLDSRDDPGKGYWYRVRIGHYKEHEEARQMANRVSKNEKLDGFVTIDQKAIK
jgi:cell division protein FtsN